MYKSGLSPAKIAKEFNCSSMLIRKILTNNNIKIRKHVHEEIYKQAPRIISMYESGLSPDKIGKEFNCSSDTIRRILKKNNIEIRSNNRSRRKQK